MDAEKGLDFKMAGAKMEEDQVCYEGMKLDDMESGCNHPALWKDGKCRVCGKQMLLVSSLTKPDGIDIAEKAVREEFKCPQCGRLLVKDGFVCGNCQAHNVLRTVDVWKARIEKALPTGISLTGECFLKGVESVSCAECRYNHRKRKEILEGI